MFKFEIVPIKSLFNEIFHSPYPDQITCFNRILFDSFTTYYFIALHLTTRCIIVKSFRFRNISTIDIVIWAHTLCNDAFGVSFFHIRYIDIMIIFELMLFNSDCFILIIEHFCCTFSLPHGYQKSRNLALLRFRFFSNLGNYYINRSGICCFPQSLLRLFIEVAWVS